DAILGERGILVLPDVLTNAGGVTVSYFEWVQDIGRLFWDRNEIRAKLADKLADAFERVWRLAEDQGLSLRSAALVAGIREVGAALTSRGIYPWPTGSETRSWRSRARPAVTSRGTRPGRCCPGRRSA